MSEPMYTLREVAELTDTPLPTVRRWVFQQLLPVERVGPLSLKRVRVRQSVLATFFPTANLTQSAPDPLSNR